MPLVTLQIIFRRLSSLVWQNESAKSFCDDFVHHQNPKTKKKILVKGIQQSVACGTSYHLLSSAPVN